MSEYSSGRLVAVDKRRIGRRLVGDTLAGVTSLTVNSTVVFDEDGAYLVINDQVIEYTGFDAETGEITFAAGETLAEAADEGDRVLVWDPAYQQPATKMVAQVDIDDDADDEAGEPLEAIVALHLQKDIPPGLRPEGRGETVLLDFDEDDDEWRVVDVLGLDGRDGTGQKYEADDVYVLTPADITAGTATQPLTNRPVVESVDARWGVLPQEPTEYTVNYDAQTITWPLDGVAKAGDRLWVHYEYFVAGTSPRLAHIAIGDTWRYATGLGASTAYAASAYDDSAWATGPSPFGWINGDIGSVPPIQTTVPEPMDVWTRATITTSGGDLQFTSPTIDDTAAVYLDGALIYSAGAAVTSELTFTTPCPAGTHVVAVYATDLGNTGPGTKGYTAWAVEEV